MIKAMGVAVALAMIPASASAQAASGQALPPGWAFIQVMDWFLAGRNDDVLVFVMPARQPMHLWVRTEYKRVSPQGVRSLRELVQVECDAGRTRVVSVSYFSASNLEVPDMQGAEVQPWSYPGPGTIGEIPLDLLCG